MCTVSVIALDGGYRLVTNRDVGRARVGARFPHDWAGGAIGPMDPQGGGTWLATRPGLTLCILNYNLDDPPPEPDGSLSRGRVIPALIEQPHAAAAINALAALELDRFVPFRLVAVDRRDGVRVVEGRWNGSALERVDHPAGPPVVFASSGLGDTVVADRLPLFEQLVASSPSPDAQDAYHRHRWPGREPVSVLMFREAARTVSITSVADTTAGVAMRYQPVDDDGIPGPALDEVRSAAP